VLGNSSFSRRIAPNRGNAQVQVSGFHSAANFAHLAGWQKVNIEVYDTSIAYSFTCPYLLDTQSNGPENLLKVFIGSFQMALAEIDES